MQAPSTIAGPNRLNANTPTSATRPDYDREAADERRRLSTAARAFDDAGVPPRHVQPIQGGTSTEWNAKRDTLIARLGTGFLIAMLGERGTGKTQAAVEVIRAYCQTAARPSALYVRAMDVFMSLKESYRRDGPTERSQLERFAKPSLLIVDESQERGSTDWEDRLLTHLIDLRYANGTDTLLLSNLKPDAFKASIGPSIFSRLIETGGIIECNWQSFRERAKPLAAA